MQYCSSRPHFLALHSECRAGWGKCCLPPRTWSSSHLASLGCIWHRMSRCLSELVMGRRDRYRMSLKLMMVSYWLGWLSSGKEPLSCWIHLHRFLLVAVPLRWWTRLLPEEARKTRLGPRYKRSRPLGACHIGH